MIQLAREHDKVVITATQMMESMINNPVPTRAEVSDVANAVLDGTDAVMLSAETAAGKYPLETVVEMAKICLAAEAHDVVKLDGDFTGQTFGRIDQTIAMGALFTAHHLGAKAIVAMTDSGSTALWMSRHLIQIPIYAFTPWVATQRRMALYRNVRPLLKDSSGDRDTALAQAENDLKSRGIVQSGDIYAITCGEPMVPCPPAARAPARPARVHAARSSRSGMRRLRSGPTGHQMARTRPKCSAQARRRAVRRTQVCKRWGFAWMKGRNLVLRHRSFTDDPAK
jgi:pyruvate kinase